MDSPARGGTGENSRAEGGRPGVSGPATGASEERRGKALLSVMLAPPALLGALALIVSDFEPLLRVQALTVTLKTINGGANHTYAMVVLGLAAVPLAAGATLLRSRPAAVALIVLGFGALAIALIGDLPDTSSSGVFGRDYENASASAAGGFFLECAGGVLLVFAGVGRLVLGGTRGSDGYQR